MPAEGLENLPSCREWNLEADFTAATGSPSQEELVVPRKIGRLGSLKPDLQTKFTAIHTALQSRVMIWRQKSDGNNELEGLDKGSGHL